MHREFSKIYQFLFNLFFILFLAIFKTRVNVYSKIWIITKVYLHKCPLLMPINCKKNSLWYRRYIYSDSFWLSFHLLSMFSKYKGNFKIWLNHIKIKNFSTIKLLLKQHNNYCHSIMDIIVQYKYKINNIIKNK